MTIHWFRVVSDYYLKYSRKMRYGYGCVRTSMAAKRGRLQSGRIKTKHYPTSEYDVLYDIFWGVGK